MSNSGSVKTIITHPSRPIIGTTGQTLNIVFPKPSCIIDSHMHIMNGACTPLPLLWSKNQLIDNRDRETVDTLGKWLGPVIGLGESGSLQTKSTAAIADRAVQDNNATYAPEGTIRSGKLYDNADLFTPLIAMPMDMEYAHIAGYDGRTIYHTETTPWHVHKRLSGREPEENGMEITLPNENAKTFSAWYYQYKDTLNSVQSHPLKILPMYHYEPRRWRNKKGTTASLKMEFGPWDQPLKEIATSTQKGFFIGIKMYPPLGYQPLDPVLTHLWKYDHVKADCFYGKCEDENIPILAHCSPGGMTTHELVFYRELHLEQPHRFGNSPYEFKYEFNRPNKKSTPDTHGKVSSYDADYEKNYFYRYHVHPKAWRPVLEKFPKLKLCLAHFGGSEWERGTEESDWIREIITLMNDYPNVYTDFSCHDIKKNGPAFKRYLDTIKNDTAASRILFGTDWYMTMVAVHGKGYKTFCEEYRELIDDDDLWERFTFINPFRFFGFDDEKKLENIKNAHSTLIENDDNDTRKKNFNDNYAAIKKLQIEHTHYK